MSQQEIGNGKWWIQHTSGVSSGPYTKEQAEKRSEEGETIFPGYDDMRTREEKEKERKKTMKFLEMTKRIKR